MYTTKYWVTGINSENTNKIISHLDAKFRFDQEIAPRNRVRISDRIFKESKGLYDYLERKDFQKIETRSYKKGDKYLKIYSYPFFKYVFDLKIDARCEIPRIEIFDLDALNHFILTGEMRE